METVFKDRDIVYDNTITDCKGKVVHIGLESIYGIRVRFDDGIERTYTSDGRLYEFSPKTLSFKPYSFEVNQERPMDLPEVGEEIMVSDRGTSWFIRQFVSYREDFDYPIFVQNDSNCYKYFKRLR